MPLQPPNLDDRSYNDLVAEALAMIPTYSPEWTNFNSSDPGITLVEMLAYLTDMLLYRLNRVTDNNTRKFLKLLNGPDWIEPMDADLRDEVRQAVLGIRERYRAVTSDDYEFLSTVGFNQWLKSSQLSLNLVARAHCVPQRNLDAGVEADRLKLRPEHVSVVIVPSPEMSDPQVVDGNSVSSDLGSTPQPTAGQISALSSYLDVRRMLTTKLHVTGPFYVHVSAQLIIARNPDALPDELKVAVNTSLTNWLNPLPSAGGNGWPFGRDVFVAEVYKIVEKIPGIDFITDVTLDSSCAAQDDKCVVADPIWHEEGDLIGLRIQEHHLPSPGFDNGAIVIVPNSAILRIDLSVSLKAASAVDLSLLKRMIKSAVRQLFHPLLGGPGADTVQATDIFVADILVAIKKIVGVLDPVSVTVESVPSRAVQQDHDRGAFIHVEAGNVLDWRVAIQLS
jgi:hypothetical protein